MKSTSGSKVTTKKKGQPAATGNGAADAALLQEAALELYARRKQGKTIPGEFERVGSRNLWKPTAAERRKCCDAVQKPTAKVPHTLLQHCRSVLHVANLYGVEQALLLKAYKQLGEAPPLPQGEGFVEQAEELKKKFEEWKKAFAPQVKALGELGGPTSALLARVEGNLSQLVSDFQALGTAEEAIGSLQAALSGAGTTIQ